MELINDEESISYREQGVLVCDVGVVVPIGEGGFLDERNQLRFVFVGHVILRVALLGEELGVSRAPAFLFLGRGQLLVQVLLQRPEVVQNRRRVHRIISGGLE